jgi:hypothetical protein
MNYFCTGCQKIPQYILGKTKFPPRNQNSTSEGSSCVRPAACFWWCEILRLMSQHGAKSKFYKLNTGVLNHYTTGWLYMSHWDGDADRVDGGRVGTGTLRGTGIRVAERRAHAERARVC